MENINDGSSDLVNFIAGSYPTLFGDGDGYGYGSGDGYWYGDGDGYGNGSCDG